MQTVHVLNGDATLYKFQQTGIEGEVVVWREILSEGPVCDHCSPQEFFSIRKKFISENFNHSTENYDKEVVNELDRLKQFANDHQILLWFEFDLTCQINLVFLLNQLHQWSIPAEQLYLICPDAYPGHPDFRGIGQLSPAELAALECTKIQLTAEDLLMAAKVWKAYCKDSKAEIEDVLASDFLQLTLLKPALKAHLDRFADSTGLNSIERLLLQIVKGGSKKTEVYQEFWKTTAIYGMGDSQIDLYLKRLEQKNLI